jgi:hypothetical protein
VRLDNIAGTPIVLNKVDLVFDGNLALKSQRISPVQVMFFLFTFEELFFKMPFTTSSMNS